MMEMKETQFGSGFLGGEKTGFLGFRFERERQIVEKDRDRERSSEVEFKGDSEPERESYLMRVGASRS